MLFADQIYSNAGDARTVREWCALYKISYHTVKSRHARGATTFEQLFKIKPAQIRRVEKVCAEKGEDVLRQVDLLELLLNQSLREKLLALAKLNAAAGQDYSVRETLHEVVRTGFIYLEKRYKELEDAREADNAQRRVKFPDGIPDQVKSGSSYGWRVAEDRQDVVHSTHTFKPMTPEEAADIGDW